MVYVWHVAGCVNRLSHLIGYCNFEMPDSGRSNWLIAPITGGEG